jgi:hypothetical protein
MTCAPRHQSYRLVRTFDEGGLPGEGDEQGE